MLKSYLLSLSERANAKQLADQATAAGFDNFIVHEGGLYKVQIGASVQKQCSSTC